MKSMFSQLLISNLSPAYPVLLVFGALFVLSSCQSLPASSKVSQPPSIAQYYQCTNDVEVQCNETECAFESNDFTPMDVTFDDAGSLSVCAYSGCWQSQADMSNRGNFIVLSALNAKFSTSETTQDLALIMDRADGVAILKAGAFAQPLLCKAQVN